MPVAQNLDLFVASYSQLQPAQRDYRLLASEIDRGLQVVGTVLARRHADGMAELLAPEYGGDPRHAWIRFRTGLVVGLFAPELLLATAVDMGEGTVIGRLVKRHDRHLMGVDLDEYFPPGSSVVVAMTDGGNHERIRPALRDAEKFHEQAIDPEDYEALHNALVPPVVWLP